MPIRRTFLLRQAKALRDRGFYHILPPPRVRRPAITTWAIFARWEPGFSYADKTLRWTEQRCCGNQYTTKLLRAIGKIQKAIKSRKMPPLTSVAFDYCADLGDIDSTVHTIGDKIPGIEKISIYAHPHEDENESTQHYDMQLEFNQGELQTLPWQITVTNSFSHELECDSEYEGGDY